MLQRPGQVWLGSPLAKEPPMRAEAEKLADAIRQSLALLRRHL
jgi:hypothetical protein